jgi:ketosteroid isomerase-like protein
MDADRPEDLPLVFRHYFNARDVAGLMRHYYAAQASYAPVPGEIVRGADVEHAIGALVALGHPIDVVVRHVLREGDIALLVVDHEIVGLGMSGTATDVARLQGDGTWRCVIDNPHGGARTLEVPEATLHALSGGPAPSGF